MIRNKLNLNLIFQIMNSTFESKI